MFSIVPTLERARALIQAGWVKRAWHDVSPTGKDRYCLNGAIGVAARHPNQEDAARRAIYNVIPRGYNSVIWFNDDTSTRKADVLRVIDKAIVSAKKGRFAK